MKARGVVVGTLLVVLLLSAMYPVRQYVSQSNQLKRLAADEVTLTERIVELKALRSRLLTDDEIERIAREELGMVRSGEVAFVIVPGAETLTAAGPPPAPAVDDVLRSRRTAPWHERWWDAFVRSMTSMR